MKTIIKRLEEQDHIYGDPDAPDLGIWDPRLNIKKRKKIVHFRSKSTMNHHSDYMLNDEIN